MGNEISHDDQRYAGSLHYIKSLSMDELCVVFEYLPVSSILTLSVASTSFHKMINGMEMLWERLCQRDFHIGEKENVAKTSSHWKIEYICYYFRRFSKEEKSIGVFLKSHGTIAEGKGGYASFANVRPKVNLMNAYDAIIHSSPIHWVTNAEKPPIVELDYEYIKPSQHEINFKNGYAAVGFATSHLMRESMVRKNFRVGGSAINQRINIFKETWKSLGECSFDKSLSSQYYSFNTSGNQIFRDRYLGAYACLLGIQAKDSQKYLIDDTENLKFVNFGIYDNGLVSFCGAEVVPSYELENKSIIRIRYETQTHYNFDLHKLNDTERVVNKMGKGSIEFLVKVNDNYDFDHIITFYNVFHPSQKEMCIVCSLGDLTEWSCIRAHIHYPAAPERELNPLAFMEDDEEFLEK